VLLNHWWNGSWGRLTRRDVWLEELPDGRFLVRWRGGDWWQRDGRYVTRSPRVAVAVLSALLGEDRAGWQQIRHHTRPD
jgi:hypothetical protein